MFLLLWFWMVFVACANAFSLLRWTLRNSIARDRYNYIKNLLLMSGIITLVCLLCSFCGMVVVRRMWTLSSTIRPPTNHLCTSNHLTHLQQPHTPPTNNLMHLQLTISCTSNHLMHLQQTKKNIRGYYNKRRDISEAQTLPMRQMQRKDDDTYDNGSSRFVCCLSCVS